MSTVRLTVWNGDVLLRRMGQAVPSACVAALRPIFERAQDTCPFLTGRLRSSGEIRREGEWANISYDTPYAVRLHENPQFNFRNGKRGKWLELAATERRREAEAAFVETFRREAGL